MSLPLGMARHAAAHHRPQEDKPDVRGREWGQQGEVGSPQERDEQNLKQQKETLMGPAPMEGQEANLTSEGDF